MDQQTLKKVLTDALQPMVGKPAVRQDVFNVLRTAIPASIARAILGVQPLEIGTFYCPSSPFEGDTRVFTKKPMNFSRAKWYTADANLEDWVDVIDWCREQFGLSPKNPDAWCRWFTRELGTVNFRDEKDYNWFLLRWGA